MLMIRLHKMLSEVHVTRELLAAYFDYWSIPGGLAFEVFDSEGRVATYAVVYDADSNKKEWNVADVLTLDGKMIGTFNDTGRIPTWKWQIGGASHEHA